MKGEYVASGREEIMDAIPITDFVEVRITQITADDGSISVDIRQWYCTGKDPTKKPTQKGVRLTADQALSLRDVLIEIVG